MNYYKIMKLWKLNNWKKIETWTIMQLRNYENLIIELENMNKKVNNFIYELLKKYELFWLFLQTNNIVHNLVEQKTNFFTKSLQWTKQKVERKYN
jgi:hypothetical protein